ncbi:MAG: zinc-dependent alcohol dehydrogenase family protein [Candidatus Delongbacteria bacterium]|nr:zinc-dependent alcohol dehydrogenase family protein [Candidatus Delongbacteria bacterium]
MKVMRLSGICDLSVERNPLEMMEIPVPVPGRDQVLIRVGACGVCHTELDIIEGRTPAMRYPVVLGHQVVGRVVECGRGVTRHRCGDRVGVAWIWSACGHCRYCLRGEENLCREFRATGRDADGGYSEYMVVPQDFAFSLPENYSDYEVAPLLCAGAIGYRSLRLTGLQDGESLGLTGFGASAHLVLKMVKACYPHSRILVFARSRNEREFAMQLGADWSGDAGDPAPESVRAMIDTTPVWNPIIQGLRNLEPGGRMVINAIRKEAVDQSAWLQLDYPRDLWMEKEIKSVANVTRQDVIEFLDLAARIEIKPEICSYALRDANLALLELKERKIRGAKVLIIE